MIRSHVSAERARTTYSILLNIHPCLYRFYRVGPEATRPLNGPEGHNPPRPPGPVLKHSHILFPVAPYPFQLDAYQVCRVRSCVLLRQERNAGPGPSSCLHPTPYPFTRSPFASTRTPSPHGASQRGLARTRLDPRCAKPPFPVIARSLLRRRSNPLIAATGFFLKGIASLTLAMTREGRLAT